MLLTVFIAEMPSAPAFTAAIAGSSILVTFGVIFASIGLDVPFLAAAVYFAVSSGSVPTSAPRPLPLICGHEKLSSIISAPASSAFLARYFHSSSSRPIIDTMITLVGKSVLSLRSISRSSSIG